ncbi:ABC transporter ATP-binding protein [Paenibacillus sp. CC-CFT742]|nr:ABC transporter ATP-binding protein [Paenibacillus sp. CC-CFT742]WJH27533.1 ABC transporter ATP-binding protein [Paenibacillus sp. CC-CFT742]
MLAIQVSNLHKKFVVLEDKPLTLKDRVLRWNNRDNKKIYEVLKDINITIDEGEVVGLIGRNGSGKSTLLKLLSKIIYPTEGIIKLNGRVTSLLELGAGFHPEFTGIENIYMNASLFGLSKKEINKKVDEIIEFSELGDYINRPVRIYSSGMYMRLAFSIATIVDPDILLIDEVLAVGDAAFQQKCLNRIMDLKQKGKTIVIVAHDQSVMERLCDRCIWLKDGRIIAQGVTKEIMIRYLADLGEQENQRKLIEESSRENNIHVENDKKNSLERWGNNKAQILQLELLDKDNNLKSAFKCGESFTINIQYKINNNSIIGDIEFGVGFFRKDGLPCYGTNTMIDHVKHTLKEEGNVYVKFEQLTFLPGEYWVDIAIHSYSGEPYDYVRRMGTFIVHSDIRDEGVARLNHTWEFN